MKEKNSYIGGLIHGVTSLLTGMKTTMTVFLSLIHISEPTRH